MFYTIIFYKVFSNTHKFTYYTSHVLLNKNNIRCKNYIKISNSGILISTLDMLQIHIHKVQANATTLEGSFFAFSRIFFSPKQKERKKKKSTAARPYSVLNFLKLTMC